VQAQRSTMKTILIVEDEFGLAEGLVSILSEEGYGTSLARDGKQGLEQLAETRPDLVLVDFVMPVMNGAEMIRELRKIPACQELPVILMSAADEEILRRYYGGYDAFLKKPFEMSALLDLIRKLLPDPPASPEPSGPPG